VRDFLKFSFDAVNLEWEKYVEFDERYLRPTEVDALIGDYSKAEKILGWKPSTFTPEIAKIMVQFEHQKLMMKK
jgi:GDPmannose 4,6-dehydratase